MKDNLVCCFCGEILYGETVHSFYDKVMCEDCFNERTTTCDCCGDRIWAEDAEGDSETTLCRHCYEYNYTTCDECGSLINNDDAYYEDDSDYPYCYSCFEKLRGKAIKPYSYKPEPIFYGSGNLFMGVELEIDEGGEENENAVEILKIANASNERTLCGMSAHQI